MVLSLDLVVSLISISAIGLIAFFITLIALFIALVMFCIWLNACNGILDTIKE